jgi:hypothetical protein
VANWGRLGTVLAVVSVERSLHLFTKALIHESINVRSGESLSLLNQFIDFGGKVTKQFIEIHLRISNLVD